MDNVLRMGLRAPDRAASVESLRVIEQRGALRKFVEEAYHNCTHDNDTKRCRVVADNVVEFAKTAALFTPRIFAVGLSELIYAADEVKPNKSLDATISEVMCGALKGLSLSHINRVAALEHINPLVQGAALGLASRLSDVALTPETYRDKSTGKLDAWTGLQNIGTELSNPQALVADISSFAIARTAAEYFNPSLCPHLRAALSGSVLGTMTGAVSEIKEEQRDNQPINWQHVAEAGALAAGRDGLAASLGVRLGESGLSPAATIAATIGATRAGDMIKLAEPVKDAPQAPPPFPLDRAGEYIKRAEALNAVPRTAPEMVALKRHADELSELLKPGSTRESFQDVHHWQSLIFDRVQLQEISPEAAKKIYSEIEWLLRHPKSVKEGVDPFLLARHLIAQVADPTLVNQGQGHGTCATASLETAMYKNDPERAVALVCEVAKTGKYKVPATGQVISIDKKSYQVHAENYDPYRDKYPDRSYASHIFQQAVPNIYWQLDMGNQGYRPGSVRFEWRRATAQNHAAARPTGVVYDHLRSKVVCDHPGISLPDLCRVYENIVPGATLRYVPEVKTTAEFASHLKERATQRAFPLLMGVESDAPPFSQAPESASAHCILILGADRNANIIWVHNPWGNSHHRNGIPLEQLFAARVRRVTECSYDTQTTRKQ